MGNPPISLTAGGPFYRVLAHVRLRTPTRMAYAWAIGIVVWLPIAIAEGLRMRLGMPVDLMMRDLSLHVRLLFTLPLLLRAELLLENTARSAMHSIYDGEFCPRVELDRIVARTEKLRDSWIVEAVLLAAAIAVGQLVLWRVVGATGVFHGEEQAQFWSVSRVWYAVVALPLVHFLMIRWLWRWLLWSYVLARLARQPLSVLATHADLAGGLAALARPMTGFSGFVLATGAILSAAWGTQLLTGRMTLDELIPMAVTFLVAAMVVAIAPLLPLSPHLFRARRKTLVQYGEFMRRYTLRFHEKWIEPRPTIDALGSPDIQSLSDLGHSYDVASKTRVFVFGPRNVLAVWFAGMLPLVPWLLTAVTFEQVFQRIVKTVLAGLPI